MRLLPLLVFVSTCYSLAIIFDVLFALVHPQDPVTLQLAALAYGFARMYTPFAAALLAIVASTGTLRGIRRRLMLVLPGWVWSFFIAPLPVYVGVGITLLLLSLMGYSLDISRLPPGASDVATILVSSYFAAITINTIYALGEEVGWRGWLQPVLEEKLGFLGSCLVTGIVWGLWHAPAVLVAGLGAGVYYQQSELWKQLFLALVSYPLFCIGLSLALYSVAKASRSILPCASMHGAVNAIWNLPVYARPPLELGPMGAAGLTSAVLVGVLTYALTIGPLRLQKLSRKLKS